MSRLKCPCCESTNLSPPGNMIAGITYPNYVHWGPVIKKLLYSKPAHSIPIQVARVCGDCGYVMIFAQQDQRKLLLLCWDQLKPGIGE